MLQFYPILILLSIPAFGVGAFLIVKNYYINNDVHNDSN